MNKFRDVGGYRNYIRRHKESQVKYTICFIEYTTSHIQMKEKSGGDKGKSL
jgi:hypothetical protein